LDERGKLSIESGAYTVYVFDRNGEDVEWEIVRKSVDFMTAANSGKRIRPDDEPAKIHGFNELGYWSLNIDRINGKWLVE